MAWDHQCFIGIRRAAEDQFCSDGADFGGKFSKVFPVLFLRYKIMGIQQVVRSAHQNNTFRLMSGDIFFKAFQQLPGIVSGISGIDNRYTF